MSSVTMPTTARTGPNAAIAPAGPAAVREAPAAVPVTPDQGPPLRPPGGQGRVLDATRRAAGIERGQVRGGDVPVVGVQVTGQITDGFAQITGGFARGGPDADGGAVPVLPGRGRPLPPGHRLRCLIEHSVFFLVRIVRPSLSIPTSSHAAARAWPRVSGCRRARGPRARPASSRISNFRTSRGTGRQAGGAGRGRLRPPRRAPYRRKVTYPFLYVTARGPVRGSLAAVWPAASHKGYPRSGATRRHPVRGYPAPPGAKCGSTSGLTRASGSAASATGICLQDLPHWHLKLLTGKRARYAGNLVNVVRHVPRRQLGAQLSARPGRSGRRSVPGPRRG